MNGYVHWLLNLKTSWIKSCFSSGVKTHVNLGSVGAKSIFRLKLAPAIIQSLTGIFTVNMVCQKGILSQ